MIRCYDQGWVRVETNGSGHWLPSTAGLIFRYLSTARLASSDCFDSENQYCPLVYNTEDTCGSAE